MDGILKGIAIAPKLMAEMQEIDSAEITIEAGITGDARGRKRTRQITVLFADDWADACAEVGQDIAWVWRRANLFVEGMRAPQSLGAVLRIGDVELLITEETAPCDVMEATAMGLKQALKPHWRGGVCCRVQKGGQIKIGDAVVWMAGH